MTIRPDNAWWPGALLALVTAAGCSTEVAGAGEEWSDEGDPSLEQIEAASRCRRKYNDTYRGWPVGPRDQQHPVRASFLDPRTKGYHNGVDISVRDDQPEPGAPAGRTHRVYALEGGTVWQVYKQPPPGVEGMVRVGHFGYGHILPLVKLGDVVKPGQLIGWTTAGEWHLHLSEWCFIDGDKNRRVAVNPLAPGGKIAPFTDTARPEIAELAFFRPASPTWRSVNCTFGGYCAVLPASGTRLAANALSGIVDVRARVHDAQSFRGWLDARPEQANVHHPARLHVSVRSQATGKLVVDREVFWYDATLGAASALLGRKPIATARHYAPGTVENLRGAGGGQSTLWFRLFAGPSGQYWDTTRTANGTYRLTVTAFDLKGNRAERAIDVAIAN